MGAWGTSVFENDVAFDWVAMFRENPTEPFIRETLDDVDANTDFLGEVECCFATAAAEVIATAGGQPSTPRWSEYPGGPEYVGPPDVIQEWIRESNFQPDRELAAHASRCIARVLENSELKDDWQGAEGYEDWRSSLQDLIDRLDRVAS